MPTITHVDLSAADILITTRPLLGDAWMAFPSGDGRTGSLRSHRGHIVTYDGNTGRSLYATAQLPDGRRVGYAGMAKAPTTEAFAAALAEMIRGTLAPLHDSHSPVQHTVSAVLAALGKRSHATAWHNGAAHIAWTLPGGGRGRVESRLRATPAPHARTTVTATLVDPSPEEAAAVLRALTTANDDIRQRDTVHGSLARSLKQAGPGLRPVATYDRTALGGLLTSVLTVDGLVTVELAYRNAGWPEAWVQRITVNGALRDVLAAVRAA